MVPKRSHLQHAWSIPLPQCDTDLHWEASRVTYVISRQPCCHSNTGEIPVCKQLVMIFSNEACVFCPLTSLSPMLLSVCVNLSHIEVCICLLLLIYVVHMRPFVTGKWRRRWRTRSGWGMEGKKVLIQKKRKSQTHRETHKLKKQYNITWLSFIHYWSSYYNDIHTVHNWLHVTTATMHEMFNFAVLMRNRILVKNTFYYHY